jgi:hypothetical protein
MTAAAPTLGVIQLLIAQLAAFLALLLLASGLHKWIRRDRTREAIHEFAGVSRRLAPAAAASIASAEMIAAALLLTESYRTAGGLLAALIWGGYLALILRAILQGRRDVDCGCSFGATRRPLGAFHVMRNVVLAGAAVLVSAGAATGFGGPIVPSQVLPALALLALYGALDQVMGLTPPRDGVLL